MVGVGYSSAPADRAVGVSYASVEKQLMYSTAPVDWANNIWYNYVKDSRANIKDAFCNKGETSNHNPVFIWGSPCCLVANMLDCEFLVRNFKVHLCYDVNFLTKTLRNV